MNEIERALFDLADIISYRFPAVWLQWSFDLLTQEYLIRVEEKSGKYIDKHIKMSELQASSDPLDVLGFEISNMITELSQKAVE